MRNPTSQGFPRCTNAAAAATEISTGRVELVKIEDLLAAVAWLEPLLRHQDALSRRISGCPGSCARSQLSSGIEQSPPPFPTDGEEQKGTKLFASRQKKKSFRSFFRSSDSIRRFSSLREPAGIPALSSPQISAPFLVSVDASNACLQAPARMGVYSSFCSSVYSFPSRLSGMADVRMLHLGSSVLLSGVNAFPEPQECGAWGAGSRRGQEGAGSAQSGAAPCCPPCSPCRAPIGLLGSTMVIYGLARGGPAPWHPVCLSWQLAQPCLAPPAAIFKAPGLHPKYSALYFWCKIIFLGRGCGDFFCMKLVGLETGRERETAGHNWKRGRRKSRESCWP